MESEAVTDFMPGHVAALLRDAVQHQHQSVLIVGPARSGKTTLLHLLVNELGEWARVAAVCSDIAPAFAEALPRAVVLRPQAASGPHVLSDRILALHGAAAAVDDHPDPAVWFDLLQLPLAGTALLSTLTTTTISAHQVLEEVVDRLVGATGHSPQLVTTAIDFNLIVQMRLSGHYRHVAAVHSCQRLHTDTAAGPAVSWSTSWLYRADPWPPFGEVDS